MAHLDFSLALHRALAADPATSMCWSPFSVASALGLLGEGARGQTRAELVELLGDLEALGADLAGALELDAPTRGRDEPVIACANTLWVDASVPVRDEFAQRLSGGVRNVPFKAAPEKSRQAVNADVAETTRQLIPELLPPGSVNGDTVSSLVNALYLKTAWMSRFTEGATEDRPFHTPGGSVRVPTMFQQERLPYAAVEGWQVIGLPAIGGVDAVVLMPDGDLAEAEAALTGESLGRLLDAASKVEELRLRLPRLSLRTQAELADVVSGLGVQTIFGDEADLSGISPDGLAVQQIIHESVLEIDEEGLEGAAATAVMMRAVSFVVSDPLEVTVDRPFLLLVRNRRTGVLYFMARVTDPS
ncbi:serpin family protein [Actinokineospora pegani]|uniref:serpin family protein n=1 Tax=Actinokineospora pegani TaxID=2654637 RepID=UPI0012EA96D8|nr:serpin family protein [Actinokineospora pegani]